MSYTSLLNLPQDRGTEKETEQFPLVIKHLNINNPEASSCIAHSGHVSAPPAFPTSCSKCTQPRLNIHCRGTAWGISLLDIAGERRMSQRRLRGGGTGLVDFTSNLKWPVAVCALSVISVKLKASGGWDLNASERKNLTESSYCGTLILLLES